MRTIIFSTLVAGVLAVSARPVAAQAAKDLSMNKESLSMNKVSGTNELFSGLPSPGVKPVPSGNNIPVKAYRHFKKTFAGITGEQWSSTANGFMTRFTINGAVSRAYYDSKGNWRFTIECYGENKLPADARAMLESV